MLYITREVYYKWRLVAYDVDTPILNVRYSNSSFSSIKQELDRQLQKELDYLQALARQDEKAMALDWSFNGTLLLCGISRCGQTVAIVADLPMAYADCLTWKVQRCVSGQAFLCFWAKAASIACPARIFNPRLADALHNAKTRLIRN